ncbi:uncharacterized protein LOC128952167 [Oppia nitens]|uniref:uncharacterized protein LOC128952167 n=1 Tax=Oppia nitens TaxID=1686743 RepID=UPI0023DA4163|nr:uncharacterized protein LOC128952167 [Oppia nitens]
MSILNCCLFLFINIIIIIYGVCGQYFPQHNDEALKCLALIDSSVQLCQNDAFKQWSIGPNSSLADSCCSRWTHLECSLNVVNTSKCLDREKQELRKHFLDARDYYENGTCRDYPFESPFCLVPQLRQIYVNVNMSDEDSLPLPDPLTIDCLYGLKRNVRQGCVDTAELKWNMTSSNYTPVQRLCCSTWDNIDCLDTIANVRCLPQEINTTSAYLLKLVLNIEQLGCKQAAYHSRQCHQDNFVDKLANNKTLPSSVTTSAKFVTTRQPDSSKSPSPTRSHKFDMVQVALERLKLHESVQQVIFDERQTHHMTLDEHNEHRYHGFVAEMRRIMPTVIFFGTIILLSLLIVLAIQYYLFSRNLIFKYRSRGSGGGKVGAFRSKYDDARNLLIN